MELQILLRIGRCSCYHMEKIAGPTSIQVCLGLELFVYKNINAQNVKSVLDTLKLVGLV